MFKGWTDSQLKTYFGDKEAVHQSIKQELGQRSLKEEEIRDTSRPIIEAISTNKTSIEETRTDAYTKAVMQLLDRLALNQVSESEFKAKVEQAIVPIDYLKAIVKSTKKQTIQAMVMNQDTPINLMFFLMDKEKGSFTQSSPNKETLSFDGSEYKIFDQPIIVDSLGIIDAGTGGRINVTMRNIALLLSNSIAEFTKGYGPLSSQDAVFMLDFGRTLNYKFDKANPASKKKIAIDELLDDADYLGDDIANNQSNKQKVKNQALLAQQTSLLQKQQAKFLKDNSDIFKYFEAMYGFVRANEVIDDPKAFDHKKHSPAYQTLLKDFIDKQRIQAQSNFKQRPAYTDSANLLDLLTDIEKNASTMGITKLHVDMTQMDNDVLQHVNNALASVKNVPSTPSKPKSTKPTKTPKKLGYKPMSPPLDIFKGQTITSYEDEATLILSQKSAYYEPSNPERTKASDRLEFINGKRIPINDLKTSAKRKQVLDKMIAEHGGKKIGFGINNGNGMAPHGTTARQTTRHQPARNYKLDPKTSKFGQLDIDMDALNSLRLIAKNPDDNKVLLDKYIDLDTLDLITKRRNTKREYSGSSIDTYQELTEHAKIPINRNSKKLEQAINLNKSPEKRLSRFKNILLSKKAGNSPMSDMMLTEAISIISSLLKDKVITAGEYRALYSRLA